jgi:hypothetical protein
MSNNIRNGEIINCLGDRYWYLYGKLHRIDGPAIEYSCGYKYWWLYGEHYTEFDYNKLVSNLPLLYWNQFKLKELL